MPIAMVHATDVSATFLFVSGLIGLGLLAFAANAYRRTRDGRLAFVAGAFTVFMLKSFFVAYAVKTQVIEHESLELIDAVGDLGTVVLFVLPILWPPRMDDGLD